MVKVVSGKCLIGQIAWGKLHWGELNWGRCPVPGLAERPLTISVSTVCRLPAFAKINERCFAFMRRLFISKAVSVLYRPFMMLTNGRDNTRLAHGGSH